MRRAVQNRAAEAVWVFDAGGAVLRGQSRSTTATGKSNAKGKRLERAWRMHTLLCTPEFSGVDGREPPLWHVSNVTALGKGLCNELFTARTSASTQHVDSSHHGLARLACWRTIIRSAND